MYRAAIGDINTLSTPDMYKRWVGGVLPELTRPASLAGRVLLARMLGSKCLPEIAIESSGKPYFTRADLPQFSISHSGNRVMVLLSSCGAAGCDIEVLRPRRNILSIAQRYFSQREYEWLLQHQDSTQQQHAFWRLWTAREALLKQRSGSVWQMSSLELDPGSLSVLPLYLHCYEDNGLAIAVCGENPEIATLTAVCYGDESAYL